MKYIYWILTIFLIIPTITTAQEMSVKSFCLAEKDLTANTPGTIVYDQNGNVCALIKVETTIDGFTFDVGSLGVCEVKRVGGELWVYVPFGIRRITLSHPQLGVIRDYQLPCPIEKGRTYIMTLVAGTVRTIIEQATSKQFLYIQLNPKNAILEINNKIKATDNGVYQELLPFGTYQYKAYFQNYHDLEGEIKISNPYDIHSIELTLKPAFGYISIAPYNQPEINGASIYIDEKYIGKIPINNIQINSGSHRLRIIKDLYEAYQETFNIADGEIKQISANLMPDFAEVTITTSKGSDIYINGEIKGKEKWTGNLSCGSYIFETKQDGHIPYKTSYDISLADNKKSISLDGPTPIYGSLAISSSPAKGKIYINGEYHGETPKYIPNQIIGGHEVSVTADGYKLQTKRVDIEEGRETTLKFTLEPDIVKVKDYAVEQQEEEIVEEEVIPFAIVEQKPTFQGKEPYLEFPKWVYSNIVYPEIAREHGLQGRVSLQFIIDTDGSVKNIKVIRGIDSVLDNEVVRVVSESPKWSPGIHRNKPVKVKYTFPIIFQLK